MKKMVRRTVIAIIGIVVIVLVVAVIVNAYSVGYTRYGPVYYYGSPYYMYYPVYYGPQPGVNYPYNYYYSPSYAYPYYYPTDYKNNYGLPSVNYPYPAGVIRGSVGQTCGMMDNQQVGCDYGLVCDYSKTTQKGMGICSVASNYPYFG
ncbi:Uncharacterised protein [uncultured archaeon]|nr:Uncharacterised protein [uncultured archaeon]